MTIKEINERIEQINNQIFYINMVDMQTNENRDRIRELTRERAELKEMLTK